jgi:alkylhydroperoxidase family enzyme
MTWLADLPAGETDWDRVSALCPEAFGAIARLVGAAWQEVDPILLELCRLRIAFVLRYTAESGRRSIRAETVGLTQDKLAELSLWPTSPRFSELERACLALAEQFVIDANGVTDAQVAAVSHHLGPDGCYAFVHAVSALETYQRACLTLGIDSAPAVDELAGLGRAGQPARKDQP